MERIYPTAGLFSIGAPGSPAVGPYARADGTALFAARAAKEYICPRRESMLETLGYTTVEGTRKDRRIIVYALSTCGFCKKAMAFLQDKGFTYRYVYVDQIPLETKNEAKKALKERFHVDISFPFAVIDDDSHLVGFIEPDWRRTFDV
jgi:glutaredoxin-like protein NrdH